MEGVVVLHETIYELHRRKKSGVYSKLISKMHMEMLNGTLCNRPYV
jgi:hypothetical protein